ncbi:MAG: translation initiation factor aIF-1A [Candidatus Marsarchaeota archaeon]
MPMDTFTVEGGWSTPRGWPRLSKVPSGLRVPQEGELVGVVTQLLGFDRIRVKCTDGKTRMCRIPGKMKKKSWIHEGDFVLVTPWDFQSDTRGDIVTVYSKEEVKQLEAAGIIPKGFSSAA